MKLSNETLSLLKYFGSINSNILIQPGQFLETVSISKTLKANATVIESFPTEFGIYNLPEFLSALAMFTEPDLIFSRESVTINELQGRGKLVYAGSSKEILVYPENKRPVPSQVDFDFRLEDTVIAQLLKAYSIIGAPELIIKSSTTDGITLTVGDRLGKIPNAYSVKVEGTAATDATYVMKMENIKLVPGSYSVQILAGIMAKFAKQDGAVTTFVALES